MITNILNIGFAKPINIYPAYLIRFEEFITIGYLF